MADRSIVWRPRPEDLSESRVAGFMRRHAIADTTTLRRRAASEPEWFYPAILADLGVEWYRPYERLMDASGGLPWTEWFLGGAINVVHNVLDRHARGGSAGRTAVIWEDEAERVATLSYAELDERVCRLAGALSGLGVTAGDAIGLYLPMSADVVVALLACLKIGAIAVPVFAGFGADALATRLADAGAVALLTADASVRRGRLLALKETAERACQAAASVRHLIVLRRHDVRVELRPGREFDWHELEAGGPGRLPTARLEASAPSMILYTSGTTGRPKGAVHTHAGVQVVTAKEVGYHLDLRAGETVFWLTDIGWMMGPWEILGVLFHGGTVVLLDGAPDYPDPFRLWRLVERHRVTHLGLAPTAVRALAAHGEPAVRGHDLSSLRILASTGEPWDDASYRWYFGVVGGGRCPVINISGGTELMGCLLAPLPVAPIAACSLQGPALGMDVDVVDETGRTVRGEVGYLVCRNAAPNMTRGFLGDRDRYLATYFAQFGESLWSHGDWAIVDGEGQWFLTGRADDTLKIAGKRVGPGEVEDAACSHEAVREAAAVGLPDPVKGTRLLVVAVAAAGASADAALGREVIAHIATRLGATMRPERIVWVSALPVTRSGKIMRGAIRAVLAGADPGPLPTVANPEALEALRTLSGEASR